jgi:hypothetical protein
MFQSKHPQGSKYNSEAYKYRSKIFRPKSRSAVRRLEASAAAAFFSNMDVMSVDPANTKNQQQAEGAKVMKELIQHRLTKTIPWFQVVLGGIQDAATVGVVCSYQHWKYKEKKTADEAGAEKVEVIEDEPSVEILAVENLRIDPAAKWYDPIGTSPYIVELMPMYVCDVREMMDTQDPKTGEPAWKTLSDGDLKGATGQAYDSTRQVREGKREDSTQSVSLTEYEIVWIHRNIIRHKGEDWVYYTAGTEHILSAPKRLKEVYFTGKRPYVMGVAVIETHKIYPSSPIELGANLQREINDVVNSRLDNVKLVLNKRFIVKRGAQVDIKSLVRNVAGSVTLANDPEKDVHEMEFNDVTSSAYQEQDRLNVEHDELSGAFSQSSVMTNRKLNETVGGMGLMSQNANQITEYTIRTVTETWVEPVLRQIADLEAHYETDETVLALIGDRAGFQVTQEHLSQDLTITVNVGMGATDPTMRLNRLLSGAKATAEIYAMQTPGLNKGEIAKEAFGMMGYRDGGRFLQDEGQDPKLAELMQIAQQLKQELQQALSGQKVKEDEIAMKAHVESAKIEADQQAEQARIAAEQQNKQAELEVNRQQAAEQTAQANADREAQNAIEMAKISSQHQLGQEKIVAEKEIEDRKLAQERDLEEQKLAQEREADQGKLALEEKKLAQEKELREKEIVQERELREKEITLEDKRQREQAEKDRADKSEADKKASEPKKAEPAKEVHVHMHEK